MTDEGTCVLGTVLVVGQPPALEQSCGLTCIAEEVVSAVASALAEMQAAGVLPDLVVIREEAGGEDVLSTLRAVRSCFPAVPSVVVTGVHNSETAQMLTDDGVLDYIEGPLEGDCLDRLVLVAKRGVASAGDAERFFCPN